MLYVIPIPALKDNYIWLLKDHDSDQCTVIDPGEAKPVLDYLKQNQFTLANILLTHHHHDHTGGVAELCKHYSINVYGPKSPEITSITRHIAHGDTIRLNHPRLQLQIIGTPGHTLDHVVYYGDNCLFCGDTLFTGGCGRLFEGNPQEMIISLARLMRLPDETFIYCGHEYTLANMQFASAVEPNNVDIQERLEATQYSREQDSPTVPSTLGIEKQTNPFLRCHIPSVKQAAEKHCGQTLTTPVEVFAVVREWKNTFA